MECPVEVAPVAVSPTRLWTDFRMPFARWNDDKGVRRAHDFPIVELEATRAIAVHDQLVVVDNAQWGAEIGGTPAVGGVGSDRALRARGAQAGGNFHEPSARWGALRHAGFLDNL